MSCPCNQCYLLGCRCSEGSDGSSTTQSREAIERHREMHQKQIRFIEEGLDKPFNVEGDQSMDHDDVQHQNGAVDRDDGAKDNNKMEIKAENGDSTNGRNTEQDSSEMSELGDVAKDEDKTENSINSTNGQQKPKQTSNNNVIRTGQISRMHGLAKLRQDLCWRLIRSAGTPNRIRCRQCGNDISVHCHYGPMCLQRHIQTSKHLWKPLYACRLCHTDHNSYQSLTQHFIRKHVGVSVTNNYANREDDYHDEIMRELTACFGDGGSTNGDKTEGGNSSLREEPVATMNDRSSRRLIKSHNTNNQNNSQRPIVAKSPDDSIIQRMQVCTDLMQKYSHGETIDCQSCNTTLRVDSKQQHQIDTMLSHVETVHAQGSYRCRQCDYRCVSKFSMHIHLQVYHKMKCVDGEYAVVNLESGFIELLRQCFDRDHLGKSQGSIAVARGHSGRGGPNMETVSNEGAESANDGGSSIADRKDPNHTVSEGPYGNRGEKVKGKEKGFAIE